MALTTHCEDSPELDHEWARLIGSTCRPCPFASPTWIRTWWKAFEPDGDFFLLSLRDEGRLIGVAPFVQQGDRLILAGDSNICDYMDVVAACDHQEAVSTALLQCLASAEGWREMELWGLVDSSPTLALLPESARSLGYKVTVELEAVCPRIELPSTWDDYLAGLSKKDRHELRRKMRRVAEAGQMRFYCLTDPAAIAPGMDDFLRMHTVSRQDKAQFMTPPMASFFRSSALALAEQKIARLYFLEMDGKRVASVLCFLIGDELWLYNSGYDPDYAHLSVGLVSKVLCLQDAIGNGWRRLDFLRGNERYKYELGAVDQPVYRCLITRA